MGRGLLPPAAPPTRRQLAAGAPAAAVPCRPSRVGAPCHTSLTGSMRCWCASPAHLQRSKGIVSNGSVLCCNFVAQAALSLTLTCTFERARFHVLFELLPWEWLVVAGVASISGGGGGGAAAAAVAVQHHHALQQPSGSRPPRLLFFPPCVASPCSSVTLLLSPPPILLCPLQPPPCSSTTSATCSSRCLSATWARPRRPPSCQVGTEWLPAALPFAGGGPCCTAVRWQRPLHAIHCQQPLVHCFLACKWRRAVRAPSTPSNRGPGAPSAPGAELSAYLPRLRM